MADTSGEHTDSRPAPRTGPLHERHVASGSRLADFGGWSMPLEHAGGGVLAEHTAVREAVGVFDVSHLGKARVAGPGAADHVNATLTNDLRRIGPGQAQYTLCCDDRTGGVVDDLIAYLRSDEDVFLVPNAANTAEVVRRLQDDAPPGLQITDLHTGYGVLAVQGPLADEVLTDLGLPVGHDYMSFVEVDWRGAPLIVCRTGYTGERGYELLPRWDDAGPLWDALVETAGSRGGRAAGLGARDTLRTEMGYALHGHELGLGITPVQARVGWAVGWKKESFWGKAALTAEKESGPARVARGLLALERGVPRADQDVVDAAGAVIGRTTSGTFSPTLRQGIALALVDASVGEGEEVSVDVRGRRIRCQVVRPPFVQVQTRQG